MKKPAIETQVVHGVDTGGRHARDLVAPIHMTSAFAFENADQGAALFAGEEKGYVYSRIANPTVDLLEQKIAVLEGGEDAVATSSGMAAIAATAMALVRPGDNFVSCNTLYGGTFALFNRCFGDLGVAARMISPAEGCRASAVDALCDNHTRFLYLETPANPTLDVIDIRMWSDIARRHNTLLVVDNTFATPYLQLPLQLGADIVVHSATKYISGHADTIGGLIVGTRARMDCIREKYAHYYGPCLSPFNAWLFLRGFKTLGVRMDRHCSNGLRIARWLEMHPAVRRVYYPGLAAHPGHAIAKRQMAAFGGMLAFEVKGGLAAGKTVIDNVQLCRLAVSLGDCDTLIQHPAAMTHSTYSKKQREAAGIADGLIRLSVGIEHADDIMADLDRAMGRIT